MEINDKLEKIGNAWEHYKQVNDERLKQIEKKGGADVLLLDELSKINNTLEEQKLKIEKLEISNSRPSFESKCESRENVEYKTALDNYIKKGVDAPLMNLERKFDLTTAISGSYGGYLLSPNMSKIIAGELENSCFMRRICSVQNVGSSALEIVDDVNFSAAWVGEIENRMETSGSTISKTTIKAQELVAQPKVSQKLLDDGFINIENYIADRLAEQFLQREEEAFLNGGGDGVNQPTGILTRPIEEIISNSATDFNQENVINLYYSLNQKYVSGASFVMTRETVSKVRMLKDSVSGNYLWQPALLGGKDDTILGSPVYQTSYMLALNTGIPAILFGNFKYYQIVDREDIRILRDPYTAKPYIKFYATKRVGGDVIREDAFVMLKCGE
ncbi:MAG: phage major capsid protein [Rickettsiales bacterium]|jgi:HK97 family phage major capsid protein|nr:phage major capsid protein [Rickettsiales bacterium]